MITVITRVWPLLLGILLIMLGNGMHFTLIGLRGDLEGFSAVELAVVTSCYYVGFLSGARFTPILIRRVGHVRVFAALGSFMSAGLIAFPLLTDPWPWSLLRVLVGFCMSGIYVTAESWLNDASTNANRGKVLSAYMIAQTLGIIGAQGLLTLGDAATSVLFIGASILVSISFAPILLSATTQAPSISVSRPMGLGELLSSSPLSTIGIFLLGGVYATQAGMGAVFGTQIGLSTTQIAIFVASLFAGTLVLQYPIGWLSDRIDRRQVIFAASVLGALSCLLGWLAGGNFWLWLVAAFFGGGVTTPLYSLFLAYTNDALSTEDMPAASGGLVFTFGLGAIAGPPMTGWGMQWLGPTAFWPVLAVTFAMITLYALYQMTRRAVVAVDDTEHYLGVVPTASPVAVEAATVWAAEHAEAEREGDEASEPDGSR